MSKITHAAKPRLDKWSAKETTIPVVYRRVHHLRGTKRVRDGALRAQTYDDVLVPHCPRCDYPLFSGAGLKLIGVDDVADNPEPFILGLCFKIQCTECRFTDHFAMYCDQAGMFQPQRRRNGERDGDTALQRP